MIRYKILFQIHKITSVFVGATTSNLKSIIFCKNSYPAIYTSDCSSNPLILNPQIQMQPLGQQAKEFRPK